MSITIEDARIGIRTRFTGRDMVFHNGEREGKKGWIVADADENFGGDNFGGGTCLWQPDADDGTYVTALADLTKVK